MYNKVNHDAVKRIFPHQKMCFYRKYGQLYYGPVRLNEGAYLLVKEDRLIVLGDWLGGKDYQYGCSVNKISCYVGLPDDDKEEWRHARYEPSCYVTVLEETNRIDSAMVGNRQARQQFLSEYGK